MMLHYGQTSQARLNTCHQQIQLVFRKVLALELIDVSIIEGHRNQTDQDKYFTKGKSKLFWPHGKHNSIPSKGIDAAPYVNGKASDNYYHCIYLAGIVMAVAKYEGIRLRWGGNWDMDREPITDQEFQDLWHYELIGG